MTQIWRKHKERSNPLALQAIRWIALNLGRKPARLVLYPITLYFLLFGTSQRRGSLNYLERVLDQKPNWFHVAKHIHYFSSTILDRIFLLTGRFEGLDVTFPPKNIPLSYSQKGQGCLLLGSHFGSFEVLRSYAVKKCPLPIKILMYEEHNPMIVNLFNALNPDIGEMIIHMGNQDSMLQVKDYLEAGYVVGMLGDRYMVDEKTTPCELLGGTVRFPTSPFILAAALKVPVVAFFGIYKGGNRYEIQFEVLSEQIELNRSTRQQDLQKWTQRYASLLEEKLRQEPYNWFNFYDYWGDEECESTNKASEN
ncbi:MAG: acyl-CoA synthetase [Methylococcales bacterium]